MSACTFFGHRDCPNSIKSKLRKVLIDLIESHAVDMFYVGQQGSFDSMVRSVLKELVSLYPHINYAVVLERIPPKRDEFDIRDYSDTMLPEGIETVHSGTENFHPHRSSGIRPAQLSLASVGLYRPLR